MKKTLLVLLVLVAGCGSSTNSVTTTDSFAPTTAVTSLPAPASSQFRELVGQLQGDRGSFDVRVEQTGSELRGEGYVSNGQEVRPVVAEGTLQQGRLGLQLYPDLAPPGSRADILSVAGNLGGSGLWEDDGDGPEGSCTLAEVADAEVRPRLLDGKNGKTKGKESFSVQVREGDATYDFTVTTTGKYDDLQRVFGVTWKCNRAIGPFRGALETSGVGYAARFGLQAQIRLTLQVGNGASTGAVMTCLRPADQVGATEDVAAKIYTGADGKLLRGVLKVVQNGSDS